MHKAIMAVLLALILAGCGTAGEPGSQSIEPRQQSPEPKPASEPPKPPESPSALVGEGLQVGESKGLTLRVIDVFEGDSYRYNETPSSFEKVDTYSMAGKFVTVIYSARNTSGSQQQQDLEATLTAGGETFKEAGHVEYPREIEIDLAPRGVTTNEFVVDVPTDVDPETIKIKTQGGTATYGTDVGSVDLTKGNLENIPPEETIALQYEYQNHDNFAAAYDLFDSASKAKFSEEQYVAYWESGPASSMYTYAFPEVSVNGDRAEVTGVFSAFIPKTYEKLAYRKNYTLLMEDGAWHLVARPDQIKAFSAMG